MSRSRRVLRRTQLNLEALYDAHGEYRYTNSFSLAGLTALGVAVLPNLPGFFVQVKWLDPSHVPAALGASYAYAWFIGFAVAFVVYLALRRFSAK